MSWLFQLRSWLQRGRASSRNTRKTRRRSPLSVEALESRDLLSTLHLDLGTPTSPAPTALIAAYSFDAGTGATAADVTGTGHTGTISGAGWTSAGRFGSALSFNGTNSWVTINSASDLNFTNGMTLEAWVKPTALNG